MSTSSEERAARRIAELQQKGIERNLELRVHVIAAIIREEVTQNVCGLNCSCHEDGELCHQCCMVPDRSSGEPKGEGKQ